MRRGWKVKDLYVGVEVLLTKSFTDVVSSLTLFVPGLRTDATLTLVHSIIDVHGPPLSRLVMFSDYTIPAPYRGLEKEKNTKNNKYVIFVLLHHSRQTSLLPRKK